MLRKIASLAVLFAALLTGASASAQTAALLVESDPTQLSELLLAKVMANDSSLWLSIRFNGPTIVAVITEQAAVEPASAADAWLRALDFSTRMRVASPPGPLNECGNTNAGLLADSGLPEAASVAPYQTTNPTSELELIRTLADAGLTASPDGLARFARDAAAPFRVFVYRVTSGGGSTQALRFIEHGYPNELPRISAVGLDSLPLDWIALAGSAVEPATRDSADPSEFPVTFRAVDASTDYRAARAGWSAANPERWLREAEGTSALLASTGTPEGVNGQVAPAVQRYFDALSTARAGACEAQIQAAAARGSLEMADLVCDGADDLALSLSELGGHQARLSRFFGSLGASGTTFLTAPGAAKNPLLVATELDTQGCLLNLPRSPVTTDPAEPNGGGVPNWAVPPSEESPSASSSAYYSSDGSCAVTTGAGDSCSGDSTGSDAASNDSCSGDSTSSDAASNDSCSGDSSSSDTTSSDSCSGDSHSSGDSSGCGKSEYDGDTCAGSAKDSAAGASAAKSSAALELGNSARRGRPRPVRLSLLTLLAAAMALPLRRLSASR